MIKEQRRSQDLDMVKRMDKSVDLHQKKTDDILQRATELGFIKVDRDRSGKLIVKK